MSEPRGGEERLRREHDALAAAVASTQRSAANIIIELNGLRQFHAHHDLDYTDAVQTYYRLAKELRALARTAQMWGGQS